MRRTPDPTEQILMSWLAEPVSPPADGPLLIAQAVNATPQRSTGWPLRMRRSQVAFAGSVAAACAAVVLAAGSLVSWAPDPSSPGAEDPAAAAGASADSAESTTAPASTAHPETPAPLAAVADALRKPQTRTIVEFDGGVDPIDLVRSPQGLPYYIDAAAGQVIKVEDDGYQTVIAASSDPWDLSAELTAEAERLAIAPQGVVFIDDAGRVVVAQELPGGFNLILSSSTDAGMRDERPDLDRVDPTFPGGVLAASAAGSSRDGYRLYALGPEADQVLEARYDRFHQHPPAEVAFDLPPTSSPARDVYYDGEVWVLYGDAVRRYRDGELVAGFDVEGLSEGSDARLIDGTAGTRGNIYVYDATQRGVLEISKRDGKLLDTWALSGSDIPTDDVRGMFASPADDVVPPSITWITPGGIFESILSATPVTRDSGIQPTTASQADRPSIVWPGLAISLQADELRIQAGGTIFRGVASPDIDDYVDLDEREFDAVWFEDGREMRLKFIIGFDDTDWWLEEIWTYDGQRNGGWVYYRQLDARTRTPRGEPLTADVRLDADDADRKKLARDASLQIEGLRLDGFRSGSGIGEPTDCELVPRGFDETALNEAVEGMTAAEISAHLSEEGLCHSFGYRYWFLRPDGSLQNRGERWCSIPPAGEFSSIVAIHDHEVRIGVQDYDLKVGPRAEHPVGWGCPTDGGGTAPYPDPSIPPRAVLDVPIEPYSEADRRRTPDGPYVPFRIGRDPAERGWVLLYDSAALLPGQSQRFEVRWCMSDGCIPLDARWKVEGDGARLNRASGTAARLTATGEGEPSVRVSTGIHGLSMSLPILPLPDGRRDPEPLRGNDRTTAFVADTIVGVGDYVVLTGWQCPGKGRKRFGVDAAPGTVDDECAVSAISSVSPLHGSGVEVIGLYGPSALLEVVGFTDLGTDVNAALTWVRYGDPGSRDSERVELYVDRTREPDRSFADLDADGAVDAADVAVVSTMLDEPGSATITPADGAWDARADVNRDFVIDSTDVRIIEAVIAAEA